VKILFTKMESLGNDFIVINSIKNKIAISRKIIKELADRHFGIGADQVLIIELSRKKQVDFHYRIFNADGTEAEQCANGVRCIAKYLYLKKITNKKQLFLSCKAGITRTQLERDGEIVATVDAPKIIKIRKVPIPRAVKLWHAINAGNPHLVLQIPSLIRSFVVLAQSLAQRFKQGINVGFVQKCTAHAIKLKVYERGAGETLACGSGAIAAAAAGIWRGLLKSPVTVRFRFGKLTVIWPSIIAPISVKGPAKMAFDGEIVF